MATVDNLPVVAPIPPVAPVVAEPAAAPVQRDAITQVNGEYVAGLWYGDAPAWLPPSTSYVLPFERKSGSQQRKADDDRIKQERAEADIADAKRRGGVIGKVKATTMSVFSRARGGSTASPTSRRLARKEKKFNTYFKFPQNETLLYHSKKVRLVNRYNNSLLLGKLWVSQNFICFRESARAANKTARASLMIPTREVVCIQRARALKVTEAHTVPEFQPYKDLDSSADSLLLYMRDRELHQFTGFWDHKSLEDTYHTMDYAWRPQAYAQDGAVMPAAPADYESPREVADAPAVVPAVPAVAPGLSQHKGVGGRLEEVLRTAPPYASTAPVVPAALPPWIDHAAPFSAASARETSNSVRNMELPIIQQGSGFRRMPMNLKHEIENAGVGTAWPRRHVPMPTETPLVAILGEQTLKSDRQRSASRSVQRMSYPRMSDALQREIRTFPRTRLLPRRARRGWRAAPFTAVLNEVRHFDRRSLKHAPAPIIKSQLPRVTRIRRGSLSYTGPSLMSEELKERIRAFATLNLIRGYRHVTPVENRFLGELRVNRTRMTMPGNRRTPRKQLMHELRHFHHTRLHHARTVRRTYAQYLGIDEIRRSNRVSTHLLQEVKFFDLSRLKPVDRELERPQRHVSAQLPVQAMPMSSQRWPEFSPVSHMPWWNDFSSAIHSNPTRRLRHVQLPNTAVFKPISVEAVQPITVEVMQPILLKETISDKRRMSTETIIVEKRIFPVMQRETQATSSFGRSNDTGLPA